MTQEEARNLVRKNKVKDRLSLAIMFPLYIAAWPFVVAYTLVEHIMTTEN